MGKRIGSLFRIVLGIAAAVVFLSAPGGFMAEASEAGRTRIIIRYDDGSVVRGGMARTSAVLAASSIQGIKLHSAGARSSVSGRFDVIPATVDEGADREKILRQIRALPGVRYAEFDFPLTLCADPLVADQYHMAGVKAAEAWAALGNKGNSDFVVVVMDTGIDRTHPDLVNALWVNANEIPGNGIDDDGNSLIDDVNGWNFWDENANVDDDHGHGTHVSGIIAARENGVGVTGIAPNTKVMTFKIFNANGVGGMGDAVLTLDLIREYKTRASNPVDIRAVNMSFSGSGSSSSARELITELGELGIAVFAAASNDSSDNDMFPVFPAGYEAKNLVSVGSLAADNSRSWFSNYGEASVRVYAYGSDILSTTMGGNYGTMSGTSMATPLALGCFLLGWSADPAMTVTEALAKFHAGLENTAGVPMGRAHAQKAVTTALPSRIGYRMKEHLALFSFPGGESGIVPVPGTVFGRGLGSGTFTIGSDALEKGTGSTDEQKVISRIFTPSDSLYKDLKVNSGKAMKRVLIRARKNEIAQGGLPVGRVLVNDGMFVRSGNILYFLARSTAVEDGALGDRFFVEYDLENETWAEYPISPAYVLDVDYSKGMFKKGKYVYTMNGGISPTIIFRFDTETKDFAVRTIADTSNLGSSTFAWGGDTVWFAGGGSSGSDLRDAVGEFNPETGAVTVRWRLPERLFYSSMTWRNGKLYIVGGETAGWASIRSSFVIDTGNGEQRSLSLAFGSTKGQLIFTPNRLYYILGKFAAAGDDGVGSYGNRYLVAYSDLTANGWLHEWKIHPEFIYPKVAGPAGCALFTEPEGTSLEGTPDTLVYLYTRDPADNWVVGGYSAPAGTVRPDPVDPDPQPDPPAPTPGSGGGGGCSTAEGGVNPGAVLLAIPVALLFGKPAGRKKERTVKSEAE